MSFGNMNTFAQLIKRVTKKDKDGFAFEEDEILKSMRVYREGRHGSLRWANLATFSTATDLFRFRVIPNLEVTTDYIITCDNERFEIVSVENVKGKGMYIEVLAKKVEPAHG